MQLPHLLGNDRLKRDLRSRSGLSFPSAVSLDGEPGIGKRTAARDIAGALLCREENGPCGVCPACRRVAAGSHPDLLFFDPEGSEIKVDAVRDLRTRSFLKPSEAPYKVFVLCDADRMNPQAQNALLKVLEEPLSSVFLLLCRNRESLLQTVRSRCVNFRLEPLPPAVLEAELRRRFPQSAPEALGAAAALSGGCLGQACSLLENGEPKSLTAARRFTAALGGDELSVFVACLPLGSLSREEYGDFCDESCRLLLSALKEHRAGPWALSVSEYLTKQKDTLVQNPSPTALSCGLAVFCGSLR